MEDLGVYSVAAVLALTPSFFLLRVVGSLLLPLLSRVQDNEREFPARYSLCSQMLCLASAVFGSFLIACGGSLITTIYGAKYSAAASLIGWLAAMQAFRIIRAAPTIAAIARGDTKNLMISNIARASGLALAPIPYRA